MHLVPFVRDLSGAQPLRACSLHYGAQFVIDGRPNRRTDTQTDKQIWRQYFCVQLKLINEGAETIGIIRLGILVYINPLLVTEIGSRW